MTDANKNPVPNGKSYSEPENIKEYEPVFSDEDEDRGQIAGYIEKNLEGEEEAFLRNLPPEISPTKDEQPS